MTKPICDPADMVHLKKDELVVKPMANFAEESYRAVLGPDRELCLAVAIIREAGPHLLAPDLLRRLLVAEGRRSLYARSLDLDRELYADMKVELARMYANRPDNGI